MVALTILPGTAKEKKEAQNPENYEVMYVTTRNFYYVQHFNSIEVRTVAANFQAFWNKFEYFRISILGDIRREDALGFIVQQ